MLQLDFVDAAVASGVLLDVTRRGGWLPNLPNSAVIVQVSLLYYEEVHILSTQLIDNAYALNGLTVNTGPAGGGTDVIARRMFELLGIQSRGMTIGRSRML